MLGACLMCAPQASAQELDGEDELFVIESREDADEEQEDRANSETRQNEALERMNKAQLRDAGFVFSDASASRRRSTALVMAALPGLVLHGAGHLSLGDYETATALMTMEAAGVLLMVGGALAPVIAQRQTASSAGARQALYAGAGLFISSYLLDVIGVVRSDGQLAYRTPEQRLGGSLSLGYRFFATPRYPLTNVIQGALNANFGAVYMRAGTLQDVALQTSRYGGLVGWRFFKRPGSEHALFVEGEGGYRRFRGDGRYDRYDAGALVGGTLDLGVLTPNLRSVFVGVKAGYVHQWFAFPEARAPEVDVLQDEKSEVSIATSSGTIPFEFYGGMNFTDTLFVKMAYTRRDGELLNDLNSVLAVPSISLTYSRVENFDVMMRVAYGGGLELGADLRFWVW